ncbi:hypothetical protein ABI59_09475 [Acidobacteria bacterium Mor1]|nr:hypothetical protein ABI59_09475 [Acidobacteria bacterium Mor1]
MSDTLSDFLNHVAPNDEVLEGAFVAYVRSQTSDLDAEQMKQVLLRRIDVTTFENGQRALQGALSNRQDAILLYLSRDWTDPEKRPLIQGAFEDSSKKLFALESVLVATVSMYAMYLVATGGLRSETVSTTRNADGSYTTTVSREWAPSSTLARLWKALTTEE